MRPATSPDRVEHDRRLLVVDINGIRHERRSRFPRLLRPGDLVVANDAATLPASLTGTHLPTGAAIEARLAGRASLRADDVTFSAVVFGSGDYHTPTEDRAAPPPFAVGHQLMLGALHACVESVLSSRLVTLRFTDPIAAVWESLSREGRPIQYSYVPGALDVWDTWTRVAARPVAFEAPSAGFLLDWAMLQGIRSSGARFATITHAAGISSTGAPDIDGMLPLDEAYEIPVSTAALIGTTKAAGGRVVAIGTTVVRALEDAADENGRVGAGEGIARSRISRTTTLRVVNAIVSGMHEPGSTHFELLRAFTGDQVLMRATEEAEANEYLAHEFGDFLFLEGAERTEGTGGDDGGNAEMTGERVTRRNGGNGGRTDRLDQVHRHGETVRNFADDPKNLTPFAPRYPRSSV